MRKLRLLIVDDDADNRLVLKAICRKSEEFEIQEASDGQEAVEIVDEWRPDIVLMDIMMPVMDGFEASKLIMKRYPQTVILIVTAVLDAKLQQNLSALGINVYIHKPIDRDLIRFKLQSIGASLLLKQGDMHKLSKKNALNPFNLDIRSFKTYFEITDSESMMDFGMWLFDHYNNKTLNAINEFDSVVEVFYKLMKHSQINKETQTVNIEESYDELYIALGFSDMIEITEVLLHKLSLINSEVVIKENRVWVRLAKSIESQNSALSAKTAIAATTPKDEEMPIEKEISKTQTQERNTTKEIRHIDSSEREILHQSFVNKTHARDYIEEIGGDVIDEILELSSIDQEWEEYMQRLEKEPSAALIVQFSDGTLGAYIRALNNLFEFTALGYALTSLSLFMKEGAPKLVEDEAKMKMLLMLLEHLLADLRCWREHIFVLQDTADIHYLDSSFFSSCMQIEAIINEKQLGSDDENDMEFF